MRDLALLHPAADETSSTEGGAAGTHMVAAGSTQLRRTSAEVEQHFQPNS